VKKREPVANAFSRTSPITGWAGGVVSVFTDRPLVVLLTLGLR